MKYYRKKTNLSHEEFARNLMILQNYNFIKQLADSINVEIIPIKGVDLLNTIYAQNLNRNVKDIDILCKSYEDCIKLVNELLKYDYRLEFPFALKEDVIRNKNKVSLLSCSTVKANVDIHTELITKKFFALSVGKFNLHAIDRCKNGALNKIDNWLFLQQHAVFHNFSDMKWMKDLEILYNNFDKQEKETLYERINTYNFRRISLVTFDFMNDVLGKEIFNLNLFSINKSKRNLLKFSKWWRETKNNKKKFISKVINPFWEFVFIDSLHHRFKAWLKLIFPSKGMIVNVYRIRNTWMIPFFYPINLLISSFATIFFYLIYHYICLFSSNNK